MKKYSLWVRNKIGILSQAAFTIGVTAALLFSANSPLFADEISEAIAQIQQVGSRGEGHREANFAWNQLAQAEASRLPEILASLDDAGPLAANWLRAAFEAIAQRELTPEGTLPLDAFEEFLADTQHNPRARRLAYEWIVKLHPERQEPLLNAMRNDPSLELRREAVAKILEHADQAAEGEQSDQAIEQYRAALVAARDLDQVEVAAEALEKLGEEVDLASHFGFLMEWNLIASFDNTNMEGFDRPFPPEADIDLEARYEGKEGEIAWRPHTTTDTYGLVNLNEVIGNSKGVIAYASTTFQAEEAQEVELRLGCINANKVWLNGTLIMENNVYHANSAIDQYQGQGQLVGGTNHILVKICQNEQTEHWAQKWEFQLRVCNQEGTAILSTDRAPATSEQN